MSRTSAAARLDKGASRIVELLQLRSGRWTLLDANLHRKEIETQLDGRIASRLRRVGSWRVEVLPVFF